MKKDYKRYLKMNELEILHAVFIISGVGLVVSLGFYFFEDSKWMTKLSDWMWK